MAPTLGLPRAYTPRTLLCGLARLRDHGPHPWAPPGLYPQDSTLRARTASRSWPPPLGSPGLIPPGLYFAGSHGFEIMAPTLGLPRAYTPRTLLCGLARLRDHGP